MKPSSVFIAILFLLAVAFMAVNLFLPPLAERIAEEIGRQKAGRAIVPEHVKEKWRNEGKPFE